MNLNSGMFDCEGIWGQGESKGQLRFQENQGKQGKKKTLLIPKSLLREDNEK